MRDVWSQSHQRISFLNLFRNSGMYIIASILERTTNAAEADIE